MYKAYKKRPRFPDTRTKSQIWPPKSTQDQWSTYMKEAAAGVHTGVSAGVVTVGRSVIFLNEKDATFVRRKSECFTELYQILRSDVTSEVYHKYFVSFDDPTARAKIAMFVEVLCQVKTFRWFITDISTSLKAQILVFNTCSADSSYFTPRHLAPFHFHFLMKVEGQPKEAPAWL